MIAMIIQYIKAAFSVFIWVFCGFLIYSAFAWASDHGATTLGSVFDILSLLPLQFIPDLILEAAKLSFLTTLISVMFGVAVDARWGITGFKTVALKAKHIRDVSKKSDE
jgi:ABC-type Fe3+ transport system permease subunit|tara:strand:+ start:515 stop:841 length:327 start_codon:yes stop_codon:yes gene_type:complete